MVSLFGIGPLNRTVRFWGRWGVGFSLFLFSCNAWASPADVPLDNWSYETVERLISIGLCSGLGFGMRPLTRDWMASRVKEALETVQERPLDISPELAHQIEEELLRLSDELAPELETLGVSSREADEMRKPGEPFRWKGFLAWTSFVHEGYFTALERETGDTLVENSQGFRLQDGLNGRWHLPSWASYSDWFAVTLDPSLRSRHRNSDTDVDLEEASVKLGYRNLELKAGELNFWWGPGYHGDLLFTNNARSLPSFSLRTKEGFRLPWKLERLGKWQAQMIGARLDDKETPNRPFLAGNRLEWAPFSRCVLGASHTTFFGGKGEKEGIAEFFNALDPTAGGAAEERANHLFGGDLRIFLAELARYLHAGTGLEVYGEFYGEDTTGIYVPRTVSYLAGGYVTDLFSVPGLDLRVEGAKIHKEAYEHFVYLSGYRYKNEFLGHHAGEDAEDLFVRLSQEFTFLEKRFVAGLQFDRERRGVSGQPLSFEESPLTKDEFQIDLFHDFSDRLAIWLAYQLEDISNFQGSVVDSTNHIVSLKAFLRF